MLQGAQQDTVDVGKGMGSAWLAVIVLIVLISYKGRMLSKEIINRMAILIMLLTGYLTGQGQRRSW